MHRLASLLPAAILLAVFATANTRADAAGFADIKCAHSHFAQVDPILKSTPLLPPDPAAVSGHLHEFFCNTAVNSNSTVTSLLNGGTTSEVQSDIDAIWTPAMIGADGNPIPANTLEYRIINQTPTAGDVAVPPNGLDFVAGDPERTEGGPVVPGAGWQCLKPNVAAGPLLSTIPTPAQCPPGATEIRLTFYGDLGCWNGTQMGPGLQRGDGPVDAHSHAPEFGTIDCPPSIGVKRPRISPIMIYPASAAGGHLSSDHGEPGASFHYDFVYLSAKDSTGQDFFQTVVEKCLNNPVAYITCRSQPNGTLVGDHGVGVVMQAGRQATEPPASAVPLLGFDHTTVAVHYYSITPVSPNPPWAPIASPARVEAPPCDTGEKPLDFLSRYSTYTWTDDADERAALISQGFTSGGTKACTVPAGTPASVPLYRLTKTDGDRILTVSTSERDQLIAAGATSKTLGNVYPPV